MSLEESYAPGWAFRHQAEFADAINHVLQRERHHANLRSSHIATRIEEFLLAVSVLRSEPNIWQLVEREHLPAILGGFRSSFLTPWIAATHKFDDIAETNLRKVGHPWWSLLDGTDPDSMHASWIKAKLDSLESGLRDFRRHLGAIEQMMDVIMETTRISPQNEATWEDLCRLLNDCEEWVMWWNDKVDSSHGVAKKVVLNCRRMI